MSGPELRLGARTSPLARAQVDAVAAALALAGVTSRFVGITTHGDVDQRLLTEIGGTGIFAGAVREALRRGEIDVAVHSLKDLPTLPDPDLTVLAVPRREDTRDVLVGCTLADLPDGARVGTGAPRRALQLQAWADARGRRLEVLPVRGNVETRVGLVRRGGLDAVLLAAAGLRRLGYLSPAPDAGPTADGAEAVRVQLPATAAADALSGEILSNEVMLPAPGQGALGLEVAHTLADGLRALVAALDDPVSHASARVERAFLARLEAGCTAPVAARAQVVSVRPGGLDLTLRAVVGRTLVSNVTGTTRGGPPLHLEAEGFSANPEEFGSMHAARVLDTLRTDRPTVLD